MKGVKAWESLTEGRYWLERVTGGKVRADEIWEEYIKARDAILDDPLKLDGAVRVADLRAEFSRQYPAWVHLWQ